jgi:hypothetical protein
MAKIRPWLAALIGVAFLASGCGDIADDDFQGGNILEVTSATDGSGNTPFVFFAVEWTDDSGVDGEPGTGDEGENDGFPDAGETLIQGLGPDEAILTLQNTQRLGVDPGADLLIDLVNVTYFNAFGQPLLVPSTGTNQFSQFASGEVLIPNDGTGDITIILLPLEMKTAPGGLRDIFLFGAEDEIRAVSTITAIVDVQGRDRLNNDTILARYVATLNMINPTANPPTAQ